MTEDNRVLCEINEQVALVTLNRPQLRNALDVKTLHALRTTFQQLGGNNEVRVIILTGAGKGFCAGADLSGEMGFGNAVEGIEEHYKPAFMEIANTPKPVIACVRGGAAGGGAALAMLCDLMVMSENAYIKLAFSDLGLIPDCGANWLLPQAFGYRRAYQMAIEAQRISAQSCLEAGVANRVESEDALTDATLQWAKSLAARAPMSMALTKKAMRNSYTGSYGETFSAEGPMQDACMASKDFVEGVTAYFEKRSPVFKGE